MPVPVPPSSLALASRISGPSTGLLLSQHSSFEDTRSSPAFFFRLPTGCRDSGLDSTCCLYTATQRTPSQSQPLLEGSPRSCRELRAVHWIPPIVVVQKHNNTSLSPALILGTCMEVTESWGPSTGLLFSLCRSLEDTSLSPSLFLRAWERRGERSRGRMRMGDRGKKGL